MTRPAITRPLWAELDSLRRILVSHGEAIEANPQHALRDLADSLA
jgi:hypothetical protein